MDDNHQDTDENFGEINKSHKDKLLPMISDINGAGENNETKALLDFTSQMEEKLTAENLKLRSSIETLQSRLSQLESSVVGNDASTGKTQDTFSFLVITPACSVPFLFALIVFTFQIWTFSLVAFSLFNVGKDSTSSLDIPVNVAGVVRVSQFVAVLISVLTQDDMTTGLNMLVEGYNDESLKASFEHAVRWKWKLSIFARLVQGGLGLVVTFLLIATSETVIDLLLNFTAMEFVSQLDDVCFFIAQQGFFGRQNNHTAKIITDTTYCRIHRARDLYRTILFLFLLATFYGGLFGILAIQIKGELLCTTIFVQFSDYFLPQLGAFSGLYDMSTKATFMTGHVGYVDRRSGLALFAYCDRLQAWTFNYDVEGNVDPCNWMARSSETTTYDLTRAASLEWIVRDSDQREVLLQYFYLSCYDCEASDEDQCAGRGSCHNAVCSCNDGWFGLRCEFREPCPILSFDDRFDPFGGNHKWSTTYERLEVNNKLVDAYYRPVYVNEYSPGLFDIIVFTGRRWSATISTLLDIVQEDGQSAKEALTKYFREDFQPGLFYFPIAFVSEPLDVGTPFDTNSPLGIDWFSLPATFVKNTVLFNAMENSELSLTPIETVFLCSECNSQSNRCFYDGQCINGTCHCSLGSVGALCQIPPVGNGHCDSFYNTLEFEYDGGDCCESTCVSSVNFTCGLDESGFVSPGYFFCHLPRQEWRPSSKPMKGARTSGSGFSVALSGNGAILAVGEPLADRVKLYDKVGSQWLQRGRTIDGPSNSLFGGSLAMSTGSMHRINNPLTMTPIMFAVGTSHAPTGHVFVFECDENDCSQLGPDLIAFKHEVPIGVVLDISGDGGVIVAGALPTAQARYPTQNGFSPLAVFDRDVTGVWVQRELKLVFENSEFVYSVSLSGNGNVLAFGSYIRGFSLDRGIFIENATKRVYTWNGSVLKQRGSSFIDADPHESLLFNMQGESITLSDDGSLLALGLWFADSKRGTQILSWNDSVSDWIQRGPAIGCGDFVVQGSSIALSSDGEIVAIGSSDYMHPDGLLGLIGLNGTVCTLAWNGVEWEQLDGTLPAGYGNSVALSSDGSFLAVGLPYSNAGLAGTSSVYEFLPGNCTDGTSLFRISLTTDGDPWSTTWNVKSNETGEIILSGGPYIGTEAFASFTDEICVMTHGCFVFTIYDNLDFTKELPGSGGMSPPGQYSLFLEGKEVAKSSFTHAIEWLFIGDCIECPVGTKLFRVVVQTCAPVSWNFEDADGETLFSRNSFNRYAQMRNNDCSFANQTTYWEELCISLDKCSLFSLFRSPITLDDLVNVSSSIKPATSKKITSSAAMPNLQYRLFIEEEQIAMDTIDVFSNSTLNEPIVSISVGSCVR